MNQKKRERRQTAENTHVFIMAWRREKISKHGYRLSELKSVLQKEIRVGSLDAVHAALEIHCTLKSKQSVWNTLFTCAVEDVGMACPSATWTLLKLFYQAKHNALESLTQAVVFLCRCRKSRSMSNAAVVACWNYGKEQPSFRERLKNMRQSSMTNYFFTLSETENSHQLDQQKVLTEFHAALLLAAERNNEETALDEMLWLYNLTLRAYQLQETEKRCTVCPTNLIHLRPNCSNNHLWQRCFQRTALKFHKTAVSVLWKILLSVVYRSFHPIVMCVIASLTEADALGLGSECLQLLLAVSIIRCYQYRIDNSAWSLYESKPWVPLQWSLTPELSSSICTDESVESFLSTNELLIGAHHLDKHTFAGRCVDTTEQLFEWAAQANGPLPPWFIRHSERPLPVRKQSLQDFLETGVTIENVYFFFPILSAMAKELYLEKQQLYAITHGRQHRNYIYKTNWLIVHGKHNKKRKRAEPSSPLLKKAKAEDNSFKKRYHAQKRTSRYKKHTYVTPKYVYKGPYNKYDSRFNTLLARHWILRTYFDDKTVQLPVCETWDDGIYLRFENISTADFSKWSIYPTDTLKGSEHIHVVDRKSLGIYQVSQCLGELTAYEKRQVLYHLILRFCCGIGDSHLGNMIWNGETLLGLDLEDNRRNMNMICVPKASSIIPLLFTSQVRFDIMQILQSALHSSAVHIISDLKNASSAVHSAVKVVKNKFGCDTLDALSIQQRMLKFIDLLQQCCDHRQNM